MSTILCTVVQMRELFLKQPIIVKSCEIEFKMTVTLNLHYLVGKREDIVIWIDTICINQSDYEEKSIQVLHMRDIYVQAEETFVWLSPNIAVNMLPDNSVVDMINMVGSDATESGLCKLAMQGICASQEDVVLEQDLDCTRNHHVEKIIRTKGPE